MADLLGGSGPPCTTLVDALARIDEAPTVQKAQMYEALLAALKACSTQETACKDLTSIMASIRTHALGVVALRSILSACLDTIESFDSQVVKMAMIPNMFALVTQPTASTSSSTASAATSSSSSSVFSDLMARMCEMLAGAHESQGEFNKAATTLALIPLDSSQRRVSDLERARVWVRIVRNYLEIDDTTAAESYVNKLKNIMHDVDNVELQLHFGLSQARILDAQRSFLSAAQRYHDISFSPAIADAERLHTLTMAVKCALLAPAGPARSRMLARLYKDERCSQLDEFGILEKMLLDRLLTPAEVEKFAQGLQPHQLAKMADGSTVLQKAVVEHNLVGVSRLYANIQFEALGHLVDLDAIRVEEITARMIEQGRLNGRIHQVTGVVEFERGEASGQRSNGKPEPMVGKELRQWGANVESLSEEIDNIANCLQNEFPVSNS
ncbi:hypothetical protein CDD82_5966 [Ophiocordyceps australis]|uniref:COP9 signalosome complex subunit 4 n=1 Tax=Ophiocordyceps australis TaxID=1399860 RepID=A0A2C5YUL9_9HYPO|nr:hypothetical protein CDD82_5966 [Ophiocordyceps australis]